MISRDEVIAKAIELGFENAAFTTSEPFRSQVDYLQVDSERYSWCSEWGADLQKGINPSNIFPAVKSILVVLDAAYKTGFPAGMNGRFGRAYCNDDRVTKDLGSKKIKTLRTFLRDNGIDSKVPFEVPHRLAAARAGLGTFGKNSFFYAHNVLRGTSLVNPIVLLLDVKFEPDEPTVNIDCPSYCRNACIASCPTGAIKSNNRMDPRRCISFLTYYGDNITPVEFREPMGMWIYGCDICQEVCPRNRPWLAQDIPSNQRMAAHAEHFELDVLIHMTEEFYRSNIWPYMFYVQPKDIWRWKMNVARVMGNSLDPVYVKHLAKAYDENDDTRVRGMCAWALGRIGTDEAFNFLETAKDHASGTVLEEIKTALLMIK